MKKLRLLLLLIPLLMSSLSLLAYNDGDTIHYNGDIYRVTSRINHTVEIVSSSKANLVIPSTVPTADVTYTVTGITGIWALPDYTGVQQVTIPNTVTRIGGYAFKGASLTSLHLPASLSAFQGNIAYLPNTLTRVTVDAGNAHYESTGGVLFSKNPKTLVFMPRSSYLLSDTQTTYEIPNDVVGLASQCFNGNIANLKTLSIPASVTSIHFRAISASNLEAISVDSNNPNYSSVDGVLLSKDKTVLVAYPRTKNANGNYIVPTTVKIIGQWAFFNVVLRTINLSNVEEIQAYAFYNATRLTSLTIPKSLKKAGAGLNAPNVETIAVAAGNTNFKLIRDANGVDVLYSYDGKRLVKYPSNHASKATSYIVAANTQEIDNCAFWDAKYLTSITVPPTVKAIRAQAFYGNDVLNTITFSGTSQLQSIEYGTFQGNAIKRLDLPASLETIGFQAVYEPNLTTVTIGAGSKLKKIGDNGFSLSPNLSTFTFLGSCTLDSIGGRAFADTKLKSFSLPASVRYIGESAFNNCQQLATVNFPADNVSVLDSIHGGAFANTAFTLTRIPSSVRCIGREAFWNVNTSPTLAISSRTDSISPEAFKGCYDLKNIVVDKANQKYSSVDGMLLTKDKETLVLFPPGKANDKFTLLAPSIRKIGDYAFYQNENLKNVVIPNRVTSLGRRAFGLCPNLNTVTLLCDNLIDPANIMQALNEATFDDGVTTEATQFDKIDLHLRKAVYDDYMANHYNTGDAVETFYQQFKSRNSSFNPLLRPGQSNDKNTLEEYIAVSSDVVSLIKANNTSDKTFVIPEKVYSSRTKSYKVGMIGDYAFNGCSGGFDEVVLPGEVSYIGAMAFLSTEGNTTSSSIKSIFLLDATASAETFSTTRFELDDTGNDYSEFARNTTVYVKKSAFTSPDFQNAMRRYTTRVPMPGNPSATLRPATLQMFQYKVPGITLNNTYGTFAREFDVDLAEYAKEMGEEVHVVAFTSPRDEPGSYFKPAGPDGQGGDGDQKAKYYIRMTSLKHTMADGTEVDGTYVPANTGVLLKVMTGGPVTDDGYFYCIGEDGRAAQPAPSYLVGVTRKDTVLNDTGRDIFGMQRGVFQPLNGATNVTFPAHKAYLKLSGFPGATGGNANGAKVMFLMGGEVVDPANDVVITSIDGLDEGAGTRDESPVYDLQGRRVTAPTKGIYVKNGKKFVIK